MNYSRSEITRAGNLLISSKSDDERNKALLKINDWRTNHLHPLKIMKKRLQETLLSIKIEPILISQRLKRLTSIEYKLDLNPQMGLGGMCDIGGYRAVLNDVKDLKKLKNKLDSISTREPIDYVNYPKESGYRSIHYVYEYSSKLPKYNKLKIELQIRTKLQHNWATAVETAGIITKTSLKSSQGPDEWLTFFKIVSSLFAIKEKLPVLDIHRNLTMQRLMIECYHLIDKLKVIETLKALRVTIEHFEKKNFPGDYYLLYINHEEQTVGLKVFSEKKYDEATSSYIDIEKNIDNTKSAVVLASANSFKDLKKAYPSYFLDTSEFLVALEKINSNCKKLGLI